MGITVITQTTQERNEEIRHLFEQIKPLLDDGYSYMGAVVHIGKARPQSGHYQSGWFRDLKEYGESQGYPYDEYSGKGRK